MVPIIRIVRNGSAWAAQYDVSGIGKSRRVTVSSAFGDCSLDVPFGEDPAMTATQGFSAVVEAWQARTGPAL